jgi:hypothetical protein
MMSAQKIRAALGQLQDDPDKEDSWNELFEAVTAPDGGMPQADLREANLRHSSLRGVTELLADLFDYPLAVGTAHNILRQAVARARLVNGGQVLSGVRIGAHDEIFQAGKPVLVGVDAYSTYCYLLSLEDRRDGDTWGVRLLERVDRGLRPDATIADFASGLRRAQEQALPGVPCRGDVFHCL